MKKPYVRNLGQRTVYLPIALWREVEREAARLDRPLSWVVQRCVRLGMRDIKAMPSGHPPALEAAE